MSAETVNHVNVFNDSTKIMANARNFKSNLIQLLVQNYLEHEYGMEQVFIYPELVNDLDVFSRNLRDYKHIYKSYGRYDHTLTLRVFLDEIDDEDYSETYEVKSGEKQNLTLFKNLKQVIRKIKYPDNTKIVLLLVPGMFMFDTTTLIDTETYDDAHTTISNLSKEKKYAFFNALVNDTSIEKESITGGLVSLLGRLRKGKLQLDYGPEKNITQEEADALYFNFDKTDIRILTLEKLCEIPMKKEFIEETLRRLQKA